MKVHPFCTRFLLALLLCGILALSRLGYCHNIQITSPAVGTLSGGSTTVSFSVTWNNSWRITAPPSNWDAAWVFVKFRKNGGPWMHASLNESGHTVPLNATMSMGLVDTSQPFNSATNPAVGVFIYRNSTAPRSTFTAQNVGLSWNYAQDGVATTDSVEVRVFGIEVVYVPAGAFYAGDNAGSTAAFQQGAADADPWYISAEDQISVGAQAGSGTGSGGALPEFYYLSNGNVNESATGSSFTLPANFPKGTQAFYLMKGEVSQGHWVAFFNTLTQTQRNARNMTDASGKNTTDLSYRNNVSWDGTSDALLPDRGAGATYSTVAMNYLAWADLTAYLDWAGLRPMSELEFERSGRGPYPARTAEYAWGSTNLVGATSITNAGTATEVPDSTATAVLNNAAAIQGPLRVGAVTRNKYTRIDSGSGYFGAADLSGNLWEQCVSVGHPTGRGFSRTQHGNGTLTAAGLADVSSWPDQSGEGAGLRGGDWSSSAESARLSDRRLGSAAPTSRAAGIGGRGVRTAPSSEVTPPIPLRLSAVLWLDAADTTTISLNGSTVSQWRDKSGGARHAVQATTTNQPTYTTNGLNGKALLAWDGSNDSMTISGGTTGSTLKEVLSGDNTYSIAMVIKPNVISNLPVLFHAPNASSWHFLVELNTGNGLYWGDFGGSYRTYNTGGFASTTSATLFTLVKRGAGLGDAYAGGTLVSSFTGTLANTPSLVTDFVLGSYSASNYNYNGAFAEIVVSNTEWSNTNREQLEGYFAHKWGLTASLPANHPYKSTPP